MVGITLWWTNTLPNSILSIKTILCISDLCCSLKFAVWTTVIWIPDIKKMWHFWIHRNKYLIHPPTDNRASCKLVSPKTYLLLSWLDLVMIKQRYHQLSQACTLQSIQSLLHLFCSEWHCSNCNLYTNYITLRYKTWIYSFKIEIEVQCVALTCDSLWSI